MTERERAATAAVRAPAGIEQTAPTARPLITAGIWLGLGLGGFFDGIVFHQILQ